MDRKEETPKPKARRVVVTRRFGDAMRLSGGTGVFFGDMNRAAGLVVDDGDPTDVFEGR